MAETHELSRLGQIVDMNDDQLEGWTDGPIFKEQMYSWNDIFERGGISEFKFNDETRLLWLWELFNLLLDREDIFKNIVGMQRVFF